MRTLVWWLFILIVVGYAFLRPAQEFKDDRHQPWYQPGGPLGNAIGWLPTPAARAVWFVLGLAIVASGVYLPVS